MVETPTPENEVPEEASASDAAETPTMTEAGSPESPGARETEPEAAAEEEAEATPAETPETETDPEAEGEAEDGDESFADMFESYGQETGADLKVGDQVSGRVISIGMDSVFLNVGAKVDAAVDKAELLDEEGELSVQVGDTLELYVVSAGENEVRLSRALSGEGGFQMLRDAYDARLPVEGRVVREIKGGFEVTVMDKRAFCPVSQIDIKYVEKPEEYVGLTFPFRIARFEERGRNIVLSRRELLQEEREEARSAFLEELREGAVLEGQVTNLMPYGAFVEIGPAVEGMVHVSELSWSRVESPESVVGRGDTVTVQVLKVEPGKKPDQPKIALSIKQISGDPWETEAPKLKAGEKVRGKATRLADFGAFVEVLPGVEGLVHISEMSYERRVTHPEEIVSPGQEVDVLIKDVDLDRRRISLSIRDAEGDPWIGVQDRYKVGQAVTGTVEKWEKFGCFVNLEPGITGLLPKSKVRNAADPAALEKTKPGDSITVTVEEIQPRDRKMTLGPGDAREAEDWRQYAGRKKADSGGVASSSGGLGSLGEKLQEALKERK
ncbi:MAG: 30S ribosomal protein S1 [Thermodesulfobacteriota bacterium]